jgi:hypothetical protein
MDEATAKALQALVEQQQFVTAGIQALIDSFSEAVLASLEAWVRVWRPGFYWASQHFSLKVGRMSLCLHMETCKAAIARDRWHTAPGFAG